MRKLIGSFSIFIVLASVGFGHQGQPVPVNPQTPPAPPAAQESDAAVRGRIRVGVNLVLIDARVTDRNGKPIHGLKPEQFTMLENDKSQKVSTFEYFDTSGNETAATKGQKPL